MRVKCQEAGQQTEHVEQTSIYKIWLKILLSMYGGAWQNNTPLWRVKKRVSKTNGTKTKVTTSNAIVQVVAALHGTEERQADTHGVSSRG